MIKLIAIKAHTYGGKTIEAGEEYEVDDQYAATLVSLGRASRVDEQTGQAESTAVGATGTKSGAPLATGGTEEKTNTTPPGATPSGTEAASAPPGETAPAPTGEGATAETVEGGMPAGDSQSDTPTNTTTTTRRTRSRT